MTHIVKLQNIKRALRLEPSKTIDYIISGRIRSFRTYKSFDFIDLIDGSTREHLQVVVDKNIISKPEIGAYVSCQGHIVQSRGTKQEIEFKVDRLNFLGKCDPEHYPLVNTAYSNPDGWFRRFPHFRPRADHFASLLRVRSELEVSLHMIMKQMDFFKVHTPILTGNDSEASSDLFTVHRSEVVVSEPGQDDTPESNHEDVSEVQDQSARALKKGYFNKDVFMITSAQLHLESLAASLSRVYSLSPVFRAERSISKRHLCEFSMFEAEEANVMELEPLMARVESIIKFAGQFLCEVSEHKSDFAHLLDKTSHHELYEKVTQSDYIRMTYDEALKILQDRSQQNISVPSGNSANAPNKSLRYGCDITRWHEAQLLDHCNNVPIFITNYPKQLKPFYMKCDDANKEARCFDLIAPFGGEICGGSLREDNLDRLQTNLRSTIPQLFKGRRDSLNEIDAEVSDEVRKFDWYLDLRRYGSFPHGGFGIGFDRVVQALLGINNIRDTTPFPRWFGQCEM